MPDLFGEHLHLNMEHTLQAYLLMRVDKPHVDLAMPPHLLQAAHHTWLESCKNVRISALHRDVARVLSEYGIHHNIEHVTEDELFSVDIALPGEPSFCLPCRPQEKVS